MEKLKIYIDRLKGGHTETLKETLSSECLDVKEADLQFAGTIDIKAELYLADDHLVTHLTIHAEASLPCSICNAQVHFPIAIENAYNAVAIEEIRGAIYDLFEEVRENILLNTPLFIECNNGTCPERAAVEPFLAKKADTASEPENPPAFHFPFADLE
ncbi:MAG: hypothetical protein HYZ48_00110 [Chlamydiales bacterium]|nr:hypothetical protein [Chlamydiales bacterium]